MQKKKMSKRALIRNIAEYITFKRVCNLGNYTVLWKDGFWYITVDLHYFVCEKLGKLLHYESLRLGDGEKFLLWFLM